MKIALAALLASILFLGLPSRSPACSLGPGYLMPSNFELVRDTEGIVIAKAVQLITKENGVRFNKQVAFEVLKVLKGPVEDKTLTLMGWDQWLGASEPEDFSKARPGAFRGGCLAYDYKLGSQFVLFLGRKGGSRWKISGPPFTRVNEEVSGADAPWVTAVTHYIRIAALGTVDLQKAALKELGAKPVNLVPGLNEDIERHFALPHGSKPYEDLKVFYDTAPNDDARDYVLWAFARGKHTAAVDLICSLIHSGDWARHYLPIAEYVEHVRSASVVDALVKRLVDKKDPLTNYAQRAVWSALAEAGDPSIASAMLGFLRSTESPDNLKALQEYFVRHPDPKATAVYAKLVHKDYETETDLTWGLAGMGDRAVLDWALAPDKIPAEHRWMAAYVIAISPLPEADRAALEILKHPEQETVDHLIQGYGYSRVPQRVRRLMDGFGLCSRRPVLEQWVRGALGHLIWRNDPEAVEALKKLPPAPDDDDR